MSAELERIARALADRLEVQGREVAELRNRANLDDFGVIRLARRATTNPTEEDVRRWYMDTYHNPLRQYDAPHWDDLSPGMRAAVVGTVLLSWNS